MPEGASSTCLHLGVCEGASCSGDIANPPKTLDGAKVFPPKHTKSQKAPLKASAKTPNFRGIHMAAAKRQQANGAKTCENGRPKTVRNREPKKVQKRAKKSENERKQAKTGEKVQKRSGCFLMIVFWPFSSGHIPVAV